MLLNFLVRFSLEVLFLTGVILAVFRWGGIADLFRAFSDQTRRLILGFLSICFLVQCTDRFQYNFPPIVDFFPFARFAMYQYATVKDPISVYRVEAVFDDGSREHLNFTTAFSAIGLPAISSRFRVISEKLESSDAGAQAWAREQARLFVRSMVNLREARGLRAPQAVEVLLLTRSFTLPNDVAPDRRTLVAFKRSEL